MTTSANLTGQRKYSCRGRITALLVVALAIGIGALAPAGVAQAQEKKARVAILDFEGIQISNAQSVAVTDQLRSELVNIGKFVVLDRAQTDKVMEELAFQQGGMTDAGAVAKVGKLLNVQLIVTGRITSLGGAFQLNVQMINVETAEIERSENILHKGSFIELLGDNITRLAAKLSRVEAPVGNSTMITGNGSGTTGDTGPSKPKWSLWSGLGAMTLGGVIFMNGSSADQEAKTLADDARNSNDPDLYKQAEDKQAAAESQMTIGAATMGIGAGLLAYYLFIEKPVSPGTAVLDGPSGQKGLVLTGVRLYASRKMVLAGAGFSW